MLKIGDVAKKTGVSIRSLRHYDEIELLTPSDQTESGYRLYSEDDIMRLQQIVSLKQMGFTLKKIRDMLDEHVVSLQATLEMQVEFLAQQLQQQQAVFEQVKLTLETCIAQDRVSLETIYKTMESIKMLEKYYTEEQMSSFKERFTDGASEEEFTKGWDYVLNGMKKLQVENIPPTDKASIALVQKAKGLIAQFTDGDQNVEQNMNKMYEEQGGAQMLRGHGLDMTDELYEYYQAAFYAFEKQN